MVTDRHVDVVVVIVVDVALLCRIDGDNDCDNDYEELPSATS